MGQRGDPGVPIAEIFYVRPGLSSFLILLFSLKNNFSLSMGGGRCKGPPKYIPAISRGLLRFDCYLDVVKKVKVGYLL